MPTVNLNFTTLLANSADDKLIFFLFFQENNTDISCKLSPMEKIAWNVKPVFWENYFNISSAENCTQSAKQIKI